jgi:nucleoside-diphosphate kinase
MVERTLSLIKPDGVSRNLIGDVLKRCEAMAAGPIVAAVLEGDGAIAKYRELMGATDPKKAAPGTIRADLAIGLEQNTVHGSDSPQSAAFEIPYFFNAFELSARR